MHQETMEFSAGYRGSSWKREGRPTGSSRSATGRAILGSAESGKIARVVPAEHIYDSSNGDPSSGKSSDSGPFQTMLQSKIKDMTKTGNLAESLHESLSLRPATMAHTASVFNAISMETQLTSVQKAV